MLRETKTVLGECYLCVQLALRRHRIPDMFIQHCCMKWACEIKYLGIFLVAGNQFMVKVDVYCRKFLGVAWGLLQNSGGLSEDVKYVN